MKKLFLITLIIIGVFSFSGAVFAEENEAGPAISTEAPQDMSQPRFMVTDYKLSSINLTPDEKSVLEIYFKNFSNTKSLSNIKLTLSDDSGEIKTEAMPTAFVGFIQAGGVYVWKINITADKTAHIGEHKLTVTSEYEDIYYSSYSSSDVISINVIQSVALDHSGLALPPKIIQDETYTTSIDLMNTGKTDLRNCKIDFETEGLSCGGTVFFGEIPAGEHKDTTANFRTTSDTIGPLSGKAVISYEDVFGNVYSYETELSTTIEKKAEIQQSDESKNNENKYTLWWLFILIGVVAGGITGFLIPTGIYSRKQRKLDEERL